MPQGCVKPFTLKSSPRVSIPVACNPDEQLTLEFLAQIYIPLAEVEHTRSHDLMDLDDLPEEVALAIGDKRSRTLSASSAGRILVSSSHASRLVSCWSLTCIGLFAISTLYGFA